MYFLNDYDKSIVVFRLLGELGTGSFSVCRLCEHRSSKTQYAVKVIDRNVYDPREEIEILLR